ncbi:unnamed protein product [Orchesella dallaii]|uniref:Uncharacterized protein n=1 Tax=Orchesella dallaii TaxID=48710 RepID=A0ABP1PNB3_9HEXA
MSDQINSSTDTTAAGGGGAVKKTTGSNKNKASASVKSGRALPKGKPIKLGSASGGSNLLPSKKIVPGPSTSAKANAGGGAIPKAGGLSAALRPPNNAERLSNSYESYLQSLLMDLIAQKSEELKHMVFSDKLATKCCGSASSAYRFNKVYANKMAISVFKHLMAVGKLAAPLETLMDFTGDEALAQIQNILSSKFDRIMIVGGKLNKPLFEDIEVATISDSLKAGIKNDCDEESVLKFAALFNEVLQKLELKLQISERNNQKTGGRNRTLLESCTATIMNSHAVALQLNQSEKNEANNEVK